MPKPVTAQAAADAIRRTLAAGPSDRAALAEAETTYEAATKAGVTADEIKQALRKADR